VTGNAAATRVVVLSKTGAVENTQNLASASCRAQQQLE